MTQLNMVYDEDKKLYLQQAPETTRSLYSIIEKYRQRYIVRPRHQREIVWSPSQKQGWIERLNYPLRPVGVIVTYQVRNHPETTYLNDGWQRINATLEYLDHPEQYGHTKDHARLTVESCELPQQHRVYNSHEEALQDFQFLNIGTRLTPYEFYRGTLAYMDDYQVWEEFFNRLHNMILSIGRSIISQTSLSKVESPTSRATRHKGYRDDYALFIRYFGKVLPVTDFMDVSQATPTLNDLKSGSVVEEKLKVLLQENGRTQAMEALRKLEDKIARETRLIEGAARKILKPIESTIYESDPGVTITMYRWLLHCAVWRSLNGIQVPEWTDFVERILEHSGGSSTVISKKNIRHKRILHSARLGPLMGVCQIIGSKMYLGKKDRQEDKRQLQPREGCDVSHIKPFSVFGDGETILEPAGLNRSRGAREIDTGSYNEGDL